MPDVSAQADGVRQRRRVLLIVDPDPDTREMYKSYLVPRQYKVNEAADGAEAFIKVLDDPPDVIVTESWLPRVDGATLCKVLRGNRVTCSIPILAVTAVAQPQELAAMRRAGASEVLTKPCTPELLWRHLRALQHS
jgi:CheY-like chemotaxis protein